MTGGACPHRVKGCEPGSETVKGARAGLTRSQGRESNRWKASWNAPCLPLNKAGVVFPGEAESGSVVCKDLDLRRARGTWNPRGSAASRQRTSEIAMSGEAFPAEGRGRSAAPEAPPGSSCRAGYSWSKLLRRKIVASRGGCGSANCELHREELTPRETMSRRAASAVARLATAEQADRRNSPGLSSEQVEQIGRASCRERV